MNTIFCVLLNVNSFFILDENYILGIVEHIGVFSTYKLIYLGKSDRFHSFLPYLASFSFSLFLLQVFHERKKEK